LDIITLCLGCMEEKSDSKICPRCGYAKGAAPESSLHLPPGTVLQGKYLLGYALGQGGFGITYLAWDNNLKLKLAIKEYLPQQLAYRTDANTVVKIYRTSLAKEFSYGREKFMEEAQTLARFNEHPNIVTVRDYFEANNTAYLVMNYHEGVTLQSYLESKGGRIPVDQTLSIFMPVLDALKEVHAAGILHRDISPDNLLIDKTGRVILIDFGAARQAMGEKSKSLSVIMKAGYSPPEQYQSRGNQGPWTDIYAVAATMYRALTGHTPLEAIDRMAEDDLIVPSKLGVVIEPKQEEALLKALEVKAKDRYQTVEQFQAELISMSIKVQAVWGYVGVMPGKTAGLMAAVKNRVEEEREQKLKADVAEEANVPVKKPLIVQQPADQGSKQETSYTISGKTVKFAVLVAACGLIILGAVSLFGGRDEGAVDLSVKDVNQYEAALEDGAEESAGTYDQSVIAVLDADYYIDYENGTIPIGDLPIGARVVDPSWEWEYRLGVNHSDLDWDGDPIPHGEVKPVIWIIVAKGHYDGLAPHVTLLSEDLIALHSFDNSMGRGHEDDDYGYNHWGDSGTGNATHGLRPWLNSSGIHEGEGFYRAFSDSFKEVVLKTTVPNKEWKNGRAYSTKDKVFIPSTTELDGNTGDMTYPIGSTYAYFKGSDNAMRMAIIGEKPWLYWTRSPFSKAAFSLLGVLLEGDYFTVGYGESGGAADSGVTGVRPVLNLKSETLVSEINY
jgi:tRNA A-37 threonylcarbamoyl transferase component Bud32